MSDTHRPDENGKALHGPLHAFFTLWIESLERFYEERDRRYEDRFKAQDEKTTLALTASKEAIGKAETATEKRFDAVNEFRGTLSDQAAHLLPRAEADVKFGNFDEKIESLKKEIQGLRESRSAGEGNDVQAQRDRAQSNWTTERLVAIVAGAALAIERFWPK